jgi:hypothetical protein
MPSNSFEYPGIEPPLGSKPFQEMTKAEARQTFEWFVARSETRRQILIDAVRATGGDADRLDYTPQSLVPLWSWAMFHMQDRETTEEEREAFYARVQEPLRGVIKYDRTDTAGTRQLIMDIGFYVAEVFMRKYPQQVKWALWTRKAGPYNQPYLTGFKVPFVPSDIAGASAGKVLRGIRDPRTLKIAYDRWAEDLADIEETSTIQVKKAVPAKPRKSKQAIKPQQKKRPL